MLVGLHGLVTNFFVFQMFGDDDGKEFIYKEPKITGLAEISHRLEQIYCRKHGRDNIKLIMESAKVNEWCLSLEAVDGWKPRGLKT